ncbi:hypothetical protein Pelo_528 [Pelomyxa schiedti]|nr:hypothetical protein Pelo_528 [Pelomyxa schiedti]
MGNCLTKSRPKNGGVGGVTVVPDNSKRKSATTATTAATPAPTRNPLYRPKPDVGKHPCEKIALLGDPGAGKTSFCSLFSGITYPLPAPQAEFIKYLENLNGEIIVYDTPGDFTNTSSTHYRRASFGLLFYDVKNPGVNLQSWIDGFVRNSPPNAELIIVGNKIDLVPCVGLDVQILLRGGVHKTFNISVKTGAGVDALWEYIHKQIVAQYYESLDPDA